MKKKKIECQERNIHVSDFKEFIMTYGWAILGAFIGIGILVYIGVFYPSNSYHIYKNECHNEFNECNARINVGCTLGCMYREFDYECIKYCHTLLNDTEEVCSQKEVDEIELTRDNLNLNQYDFETLIIKCIDSGICIDRLYSETIKMTVIPKERITKGWLKINCECLEPDKNLGNGRFTDKCDKWKCGEYIIW